MYTIHITLRDTRCSAVLVEQVPLTTGSRGQFQAVLSMDEGWADLDKTVIFYTATRSRAVFLGKETSCLVPAEVLQAPAATLSVGVQGIKGDTVWCSTLAQVVGLTPGAYLPSEDNINNQPDLYSQLMAAIDDIRKAVSAVTSVNGESGDVVLDAASVGALPADTEFPTELPAVAGEDAGKFLRVSAEGVWAAEALASAEGGSY